MLFSKIKNNTIRSILSSIVLYIILIFMYSLVFCICKNTLLSYFVSYSLFILFYCKSNNSIKDDYKNFKNVKNKKKIFLVSFLLLFVGTVINYIINKYTGSVAQNETSNIELIKSNFLISSLFMIVIAPIAEEIIFRHQYKNSNKLFTYILYSAIFSLTHVNFTNINDIIYLIPYMLLSFGVGYSFYKSNNIVMSIICHILNNLVVIMLLFI